MIFILLAIDWITGVYRSHKFKRKFTSYRLRKSTEKMFGYLLALISIFILEHQILFVDWGLIRIVAGYIALTELASIYENIAAITGKAFIKDLIDLIKNKIKNDQP